MKIRSFLLAQMPSRAAVIDSLRSLAMILGGALLLSPLVGVLPLFGFDWFMFFNCGNPTHCLNSNLSTYPPFANLFLQLLTWMYWRHSLSILNAITLISIAIGTWKQGGRYGSVLLAILTAPVAFLLWIGHPDSIALMGVVTGIIPFTLVKPPVAIWSIFSNRKLVFWTGMILLASVIIWPMWFMNMGMTYPTKDPAFGWPRTGWPILILGLVLLVGAGNNPFRLMAAGTMITPYLLPYHLAILAPGIGAAKGYRKILIWVTALLVALGTGLGGLWNLLNFLYPLAVYFGNYSLQDVRDTILLRYNQAAGLFQQVLKFKNQLQSKTL